MTNIASLVAVNLNFETTFPDETGDQIDPRLANLGPVRTTMEPAEAIEMPTVAVPVVVPTVVPRAVPPWFAASPATSGVTLLPSASDAIIPRRDVVDAP